MYALVDGNNFFVSCERVFRPDLAQHPTIVLSNNDGCAIARSPEAKALGIAMGQPVYQVKDILQQHNVAVFSANFILYGDLSARIVHTLRSFSPHVHVYSIDESFLDLSGYDGDRTVYGQAMRQKILKWVGVPTCVGIAPTKTLAKAANHLAKRYPHTQGVLDLSDPTRRQKALALMDVDDVWGIGRKLSFSLKLEGIKTALDLANANPTHMRKRYSVMMERTIRELAGQDCFSMESAPGSRKTVICSRSFGEPVTSAAQLRQALSFFVHRAGRKLREDGLLAGCITVYARTSQFAKEPFYGESYTLNLPEATDDTAAFLQAVEAGLQHIFRPNTNFKKAGICLFDLTERQHTQSSLFSTARNLSERINLMGCLDRLNRRYGDNTLFYGSTGTQKDRNVWMPKSTLRSAAYTTNWSDIRKVI
ncbi:MAG: DUF4113 domain-containing protein [Proteobacteria bacterium]|nr:DUF4113 domain-containing protein [Pseudomonadota bacterium]